MRMHARATSRTTSQPSPVADTLNMGHGKKEYEGTFRMMASQVKEEKEGQYRESGGMEWRRSDTYVIHKGYLP